VGKQNGSKLKAEISDHIMNQGANMNRILLVDDEQNVLNALRRELHGEHEIEAFTSPKDALTRSREAVFDLVIADYLMPDMNGVQFLKQLGEIQPDVARLILSGQADIQGLLGAINETHIYRFIAKPWDEAELKSAIEQALNYRRILQENRRLAESYRGSSLAPEPSRAERRHSYRIAVVNGDEGLLGLIRNGLIPGDDHKAEIDALWREISRDFPAAPASIEFQVDTFVSGKKALDQTRFTHYDLVIAGQTLPDMSGIQFLGKWMQAQPDSARIIMGCLADATLLSQAINEAQVYCCLDCDWETRELKADIRRRIWHIHRMQSTVMDALAARALVLENERLAKEIREYGW
jgi:DNA-binding NtrC family response regulator